jgi:Putative transposase DNA-binding domain
VDQAWALGATVIYVEDLATLEARGRRTGNARLSGQVRGAVVDAIRHLASRQGVVTVTVPARGTSKLCPRCGKALHHAPAPDRTRERGWRWASCPSRGLAGDRDHAAAERIVARGLLARALVGTEQKTGDHTIAQTVDGNTSRARRPKHRTRAARRADRTHSPCRARRPGAGWGFHRNVTATAVLLLGDYGPATAWPRPARNA